MTVRNPTPRRERWDFLATMFGCAVAVVLVAIHVLDVLRAGGVPSGAGLVAGDAAVTDGRAIDPARLAPETVGMLWSAFALEVVLVLVVIGLVAAVTRRCLRGDVFTPLTVRLVGAASWVLMAYLVVVPILSRLGGNLALRDLERTDADVPGMDLLRFTVIYLFVMTLSLAWVAFRRGTLLREDQDGLV